MHTKSCFSTIGNSHLTRYQQLQDFKASRKGVIKDYSKIITSSISHLHNKSSAIIYSRIQRSYKIISSCDLTKISDISSSRTFSDTTAESNTTTHPKGSFIFGMDINYWESIHFHYTCGTIFIAGIIISEGISFNISQKPIFKKVLYLARNISKTYIPPNKNCIFR